MSAFTQDGFAVRLEWGPEGLAALAPHVNVLVIVDVLSFTTCVCAGVERGAVVYPFGWKDERAAEFAVQQGALLAESRSRGTGLSLSPRSLLRLQSGDKIVLPSPNGSQLSTQVSHLPVIAGCLRNATAVAEAAMTLGRTVGVIAAGERWKGTGLLRPCFEDLAGAGAIVHALLGSKLPEAESAATAFVGSGNRIPDLLMNCASGRELIEMGYAEDVRFSAEYDVSRAVPVLRDSAYVAFTKTG